MVGNDVVDLRDPDLDAHRDRARFDARVLDEAERRVVHAAADVALARWAHWAAKEAGYKLLRKRAPETIFSPVRFAVRLDAAPDAGRTRWTGRVEHGEDRMALEIGIDDGAVHALATWPGDDPAAVLTGRRRLAAPGAPPIPPAEHSRAVRRLALDAVAARLGVDPGRLGVAKRDRIPYLQRDGADLGADLSLSHHGAVVAFACRLPGVEADRRLAS